MITVKRIGWGAEVNGAYVRLTPTEYDILWEMGRRGRASVKPGVPVRYFTRRLREMTKKLGVFFERQGDTAWSTENVVLEQETS